MKAATKFVQKAVASGSISIHAAREGGDRDETLKDYFRQISIHAAREGGDAFADAFGEPVHVISIHAAREGGDIVHCHSVGQLRISIHAAREGGDLIFEQLIAYWVISIHAAREGGDNNRKSTLAL